MKDANPASTDAGQHRRPRGVHLSRPVHRSRHLAGSQPAQRETGRSDDDPELPDAGSRSRLPVRRRPGAAPVPVSAGRAEVSHRDGVGLARRDRGHHPASAERSRAHPPWRGADRRPPQRRKPRRRADAPRVPEVPQQGRRSSRRQGTPARSCSTRRRSSSAGTTSGWCCTTSSSASPRPGIVAKLLLEGRKFYRFKSVPFMPVEFAGAAYRLGHSMVREEYSHNRVFRPVPPRWRRPRWSLLFNSAACRETSMASCRWPPDASEQLGHRLAPLLQLQHAADDSELRVQSLSQARSVAHAHAALAAGFPDGTRREPGVPQPPARSDSRSAEWSGRRRS